MAGPWEKYQSTTPAPPSGGVPTELQPWERYQKQQEEEANQPPGPTLSAADQASQDRIQKLVDLSMGVYHAYGGGKGSPAAAAGDIYSQNNTLGLTKPIDALANAVSGAVQGAFGYGDVPDATMGERWAAANKAYDQKMAEARASAGGLGTAAGVAGSVMSPANWEAPGASYGKQVAMAFGTGALQGAAEHPESVGSAAYGAGWGGGLNAVGTALLNPVFHAGASMFTPTAEKAVLPVLKNKEILTQTVKDIESGAKPNPYPPEVWNQMKRVVNGTLGQKAVRFLGNTVEVGGGGLSALTAADLIAQHVLHGESLTPLVEPIASSGASWLGGQAIKKGADLMAQNEIKTLARMQAIHQGLLPSGPPTRQAIANAITRGFSLYGTGAVTGP